MNNIGYKIAIKRKELGFTQQNLADKLNISFQAVSKWENNISSPDISLLPQLAGILHTSVDSLLGYTCCSMTEYEEKYNEDSYYWGLIPSQMCYDILRIKPPVKPYRVLDMGCGEGKDAVFLARNGYQVTAFDIADTGLKKARKLAKMNGVHVDFFRADINDYLPTEKFDIIFSSGVFHYISANRRHTLVERMKECTNVNGIHAINVFVKKAFISEAPDMEQSEKETEPWYSGELNKFYYDWKFHKSSEIIFDCNSSRIPHQHCMNIIVAEKKI